MAKKKAAKKAKKAKKTVEQGPWWVINDYEGSLDGPFCTLLDVKEYLNQELHYGADNEFKVVVQSHVVLTETTETVTGLREL